ncbi:MAG: radical SAM protein [Desulfobacteraceae bacterium]|nr:radical SAM protein [Desulfobacteraceae bacterium]
MLTSVHFILTYTCNFECDHCFLYCSPRTEGTFTIQQVQDVMGEFERLGTVTSVGFEGGEPFLFYPLLCESVRIATAKGFKTAVQTNCYWATTSSDARLWLAPLKKAGLCVLEVSDDAFHHDKDEDNNAKNAAAAAKALGLNINSICIKKPEVKVQTDQKKGDPIYLGGPKLRGRAADKLIKGLPITSHKAFIQCPFEDLEDPTRVHIDPFGNIHLCQGLSMGNFLKTPFSEIVQTYDPSNHPVAGPLIEGGPLQLAKKNKVSHENKYVDACHMCTSICKKLVDRFPQVLTPAKIYGIEDSQE